MEIFFGLLWTALCIFVGAGLGVRHYKKVTSVQVQISGEGSTCIQSHGDVTIVDSKVVEK